MRRDGLTRLPAAGQFTSEESRSKRGCVERLPFRAASVTTSLNPASFSSVSPYSLVLCAPSNGPALDELELVAATYGSSILGSHAMLENPMRWSLPLRFVLAVAVGLGAAAWASPRRAFALDAPGPAAAGDRNAPLTLDTLMTRFRGIAGLSAHYREEKRIALLAEPLVSEGTVHYAPPNRIARHTLTPTSASVVLDGTTLRFGDGKTERSIDVASSPVVRAFVDSFLSVLAGDRAALERSFKVDFQTPGAQKWELTLTPREASLGGILRDIRFTGDALVLSQMRIREASGDEGVTTFSEVDTAHVYSPAEASRVFRLAP